MILAFRERARHILRSEADEQRKGSCAGERGEPGRKDHRRGVGFEKGKGSGEYQDHEGLRGVCARFQGLTVGGILSIKGLFPSARFSTMMGRKKGDEMPQAVKLVLVCMFCIGLITAIVYLVKWLW